LSLSKPKPPLPKLDLWGYLALAYPLGLSPKAPGTAGSLAGLPLGMVISYAPSFLGLETGFAKFGIISLFLLAFTLFAWFVISKAEAAWQTHDDGRIVIDEVIGQAIPIAFLGDSLAVLTLSFLLFRLFDILKPGPIGWADLTLPGAWGTLIDDVIAGIFTLISLLPLVLL
jgi:phosphatidylglycerophosphatase A